MSTPIQNDYKPHAPRHVRMPTDELKQKMLFMVSLQTEQQRQCSAGSNNGDSNGGNNGGGDDEPDASTATAQLAHSPTPFPTLKASNYSKTPPPQSTMQAPALTIADTDFFLDPAVGTGTMTMNFDAMTLQQQQQVGDSLEASPIVQRPSVLTMAAPADHQSDRLAAAAASSPSSSSSSSLLLLPASSYSTQLHPTNTARSSTLKPAVTLQRNLQSYGTLLSLDGDNDPEPPSNALAYQEQRTNETAPLLTDSQQQAMMSSEQQQQQQQEWQQQQQAPQHDFYYGHAAGIDPYAPTEIHDAAHQARSASYQHLQQQHTRNDNKSEPLHSMPVRFHHRSLLSRMCACCVGRPIQWRQSHSHSAATSSSRRVCFSECLTHNDCEPLLRSLCYGAIDGLLTGSSILGAFYGLHLLSATIGDAGSASASSSSNATLLLICLSASACIADALCMGLGHVWTTTSLTETQIRERALARRSLLQHRADAKGQLVDMLLQKGMLKIDAMSLADTLEGYPDLFASALLGEALVGGGGDEDDDNHAAGRISRLDFYNELEYGSGHDSTGATTAGGVPPPSMLDVPSRPRVSESSHHALTADPVSQAVSAAASEARKEALCMVLGFGLFSLVPSLVVHGVTVLISAHGSSSSSSEHDDDVTSFSLATHPNIIAMTIIASVMWILGVWKSRFVDSHWLVYAVETVVVWWLCMACAYFVGTLLKAALLSNGFILEVAATTKASIHAMGQSST